MGQLVPHWRTNILTINHCTNLISCRLHNNTYGHLYVVQNEMNIL